MKERERRGEGGKRYFLRRLEWEKMILGAVMLFFLRERKGEKKEIQENKESLKKRKE